MKKILMTLAVMGLVFTATAQNEKPSSDPNPDSLVNKANYNTTRTSKTIKADSKKDKKGTEKPKTEVNSGGGGQHHKTLIFQPMDKRNLQR